MTKVTLKVISQKYERSSKTSMNNSMHKLEHLVEMNKFLEAHNLPGLNQEEMKLNRETSTAEIESLINNQMDSKINSTRFTNN